MRKSQTINFPNYSDSQIPKPGTRDKVSIPTLRSHMFTFPWVAENLVFARFYKGFDYILPYGRIKQNRVVKPLFYQRFDVLHDIFDLYSAVGQSKRTRFRKVLQGF